MVLSLNAENSDVAVTDYVNISCHYWSWCLLWCFVLHCSI